MKIKTNYDLRLVWKWLIAPKLFVFNIFIVASLINIAIASSAIAKSPTNSDLITQKKSDRNTDFLLKGKQLYDLGQLVAAANVWEEAKQNYQNDRQISNLIHSNNYLATVYQDLGDWKQAELAIAHNLELIASSQPRSRGNTKKINSSLLYAQTLNTQGSWQLKQGKAEAAIATWQQSESIYRDLEDKTGIILSQINQAQALQTLGFFRRSQKQLQKVQQQLDSISNTPLKMATLRTLGTALEVSGDIKQAQKVLEQSLTLAKEANSPGDIGESLFRLGNVARIRDNKKEALNYYQQATVISPIPQTKLNAELNQLSLSIETQNDVIADRLITTIKPKLSNLSASRETIYARVNYAQSLIVTNNPSAQQFLEDTVQIAQSLEDNIARSYALDKLGYWHELNGNYPQALKISNEALTLAEASNATQITAIANWQKGRILKAQGNKQQAIYAYQSAVEDLGNLHQDLVAVNPTLQFSFRQQVEPIYRQLVELLLEDVDRLPPATKQKHLEQSRIAIETLQQKELENFFRIACLDVNKQNIEQIDPQAAVIYPILLDGSVEVILSIPDRPLQHYRTQVNKELQTQTFDDLLQYLNPVFSSKDLLPTTQKLYNWLIRPAETILQEQNINTLVFVLDGNLRSLPMSVLHDGKQYLIEKYDLALTPGLDLLPSKTLEKDELIVLTGGLTQSRQGFKALPGVEREIANINRAFSTQVLLNSNFTNDKVQSKVEQESVSVIHLATHGQFSSNAEDTYILTWDDRINVNDFDRLLSYRNNDRPIELLVLSACRTATGDEQAILGLAGMAVRSGARSTIATLWSVSDRSTAELMTKFYYYLNQPGITKSQAMRKAQLSLLLEQQYSHPYYWSPFVLLGNWQ